MKFTVIPTPSTGLGMKDAQCSTNNQVNEWVEAGSQNLNPVGLTQPQAEREGGGLVDP